MSQPVWKLLRQLDHFDDREDCYYYVFVDETGVYTPELDILRYPDRDIYKEDDPNFVIHTVVLNRCTYENGVLSDNEFHPEWPAWYADDLDKMWNSMGFIVDNPITSLCHPDPCQRALVYLDMIDYFGAHELDQYPYAGTSPADLTDRVLKVTNPLEYVRRVLRKAAPEYADMPKEVLADWLFDRNESELLSLITT